MDSDSLIQTEDFLQKIRKIIYLLKYVRLFNFDKFKLSERKGFPPENYIFKAKKHLWRYLREPVSVVICGEFATLPPTLLASCEISDIQPNHTIFPRLYCCQVLTEIAGQSCTSFSRRGERVRYIHSKLLLSFAAESTATGPQSGKAPTPYHSLPLPHLVHIIIVYTASPDTWFLREAKTPWLSRQNFWAWGPRTRQRAAPPTWAPPATRARCSRCGSIVQTTNPDNQCCGSGMFMSDPGYKFFPFRIQGQKDSESRIPDPHQRI